MATTRGRVGLVAALLGLHPPFTSSAVYDRAITVFSPQGDLLQVSYAEQAVQRGTLAVAATNGREAIVMCVERPRDGEEDTDDLIASKEATGLTADEEKAAGNSRDRRRTKRRHKSDTGTGATSGRRSRSGAGLSGSGLGVGVVDEANNQDRKLCEVDEGVFLTFAGISADGRVLASKIRLECQNYRYGMGVAPSMGYIARYIGGLQHRYTRTGGARPFGVSCVIAGFDEDGTPRIFRSEPSGAFAEWTASAVGKASDKALSKLESVSDFGLLDWRDTAEVAVRAALVGGAQSCDVLVLRENSQSAPPHQEGETEKQALEMAAGVGLGGGGVYARRFFGSVNSDGGVLLRPVGGLEEDDLEQGDPIGVAGRVRRFAGS